MNHQHPFTLGDLLELNDRLLSRADACVAMQEVHDGNRSPHAIALRHDVDAGHALATALQIAEWEAAHGYRSTYFLLHTSPYWGGTVFDRSVDRLVSLGHEIGIHANALAEALRTGRDPDLILHDALNDLRALGVTVRGVAAHGDEICNRDRRPDEGTFVNDEQFVECRRPKEGDADRKVSRGQFRLRLSPRPLADFGLEYEALQLGLPTPFRVSDSGGYWSMAFDQAVSEFEVGDRQLHLLWHPDWWAHAFVAQEIAA
jgi:hypothetical protein